MPRDVNGNYTLPSAYNPVITDTVISSAWANTTLSDLATAMTNSLDRTGTSSGMTGQFRATAGTIGAPGISYQLEPTSGIYRAGAGDFRFSIAGADAFRWLAAQTLYPAGSSTNPGIAFLGDLTTGLYQPAALSLDIVTNGLVAGTISSAQAWSIPAPATAVVALTVNGAVNTYTQSIVGNSTNAESFGLEILAGTTSADVALLIENQAGSSSFVVIHGDGSGRIGSSVSLNLSWNTAGAFSIAAASSGRSLTVNGGSGNYTAALAGNSASGNSYGLYINAGTNTSDVAFRVDNQAASSTYFEIWGDGEIVIPAPAAATEVSGSVFQIGYLETPLNAQTAANYTLALSDRGKFIRCGAGFTYTIPANSSVAFPVGTTIVIMNAGGSSCSIAITTDVMTWLPSGGTGTRTLAANSVATLYKYQSTGWYVWGFGLT